MRKPWGKGRRRRKDIEVTITRQCNLCKRIEPSAQPLIHERTQVQPL